MISPTEQGPQWLRVTLTVGLVALLALATVTFSIVLTGTPIPGQRLHNVAVTPKPPGLSPVVTHPTSANASER